MRAVGGLGHLQVGLAGFAGVQIEAGFASDTGEIDRVSEIGQGAIFELSIDELAFFIMQNVIFGACRGDRVEGVPSHRHDDGVQHRIRDTVIDGVVTDVAILAASAVDRGGFVFLS